MHFAAHIEVGESMRNPRKYFRNNVVHTLNLLDAMAEKGIKEIVFSSTAAVYGDPLTVPIPEEHRLLPVNPYGESKLFVERALRWYGDAHGLRWAALRYFNAAGADPGGEIGEDHEPESHLIPLAIERGAGPRGALQVFGTDYPTPDGTAVRDYVHVVDLAEAHLLALRHLAAGKGNFVANVGTGRGHSVREVVAAVERVSGRTVPRREVARRPATPRRSSPTRVWRRAARLCARAIPSSTPSWSTHGNGTHRERVEARDRARRAARRRSAPGCGKPICPRGSRSTPSDRTPGASAFCQSRDDKSRAAWLELHDGTERRQLCPFVGGRPAGLYQAWHPGGARRLEGHYDSGKKIGRWTQWAADGRKVADGEYRDGQLVEGAPVGFPATCESVTW